MFLHCLYNSVCAVTDFTWASDVNIFDIDIRYRRKKQISVNYMVLISVIILYPTSVNGIIGLLNKKKM